MAIRLWGSKTPGNAQSSRDITLLRNKKRVNTHSFAMYVSEEKNLFNPLFLSLNHFFVYIGNQNVDNSCASFWLMLVPASILQYIACNVGRR